MRTDFRRPSFLKLQERIDWIAKRMWQKEYQRNPASRYLAPSPPAPLPPGARETRREFLDRPKVEILIGIESSPWASASVRPRRNDQGSNAVRRPPPRRRAFCHKNRASPETVKSWQRHSAHAANLLCIGV